MFGVSDPTESRPGRQHVVESAIGIQCDSRQGIVVGPGDAGCSVSGNVPSVVEHQSRSCRGAVVR